MRRPLAGLVVAGTLLAGPTAHAQQDNEIAWLPVIVYDWTIYFDVASSVLTADAHAVLRALAADALGYDVERIDVVGHADRVGGYRRNLDLSMQRALAVRAALVAHGVPAAVIAIRASGELELPVETADGVGEPQNRRVDIVLVPRS